MTTGQSEISESQAIESIKDLVADDSYNIGQTEESEALKEQVRTEVKPEVKEAEVTEKVEESADKQPAEAKQLGSEEVEIDYEGNRYKVPAELKDAFLRQQDYTKKTMTLAEERKQIEALKGQADPKVMEEFKQKLATYETLLGQAVTADQQRDWVKLLNEDPIEYLRQKELATTRAAELEKVTVQNAQKNTEQNRQAIVQESQQLIAKRPEWKDAAVWKADHEKMQNFLTQVGYRPDEISGIVDHRAFIIADKARKYDELMAAKGEVVKKIEKLPPKVERPGVAEGPEGQASKAAMTSLRKTGSVDDAAAALRALMG